MRGFEEDNLSVERPGSSASFASFRVGCEAREALMLSVLRGGSLDDIQRMIGTDCQHGGLCDADDVLAGGRTPLHLAVVSGRTDACRYLLCRGAQVDPCDDDGHTPLSRAIEAKSIQIVKLLLDHGADPFVSEHGNAFPLMECSSDELMRILLQACAKRITPRPSPSQSPVLEQEHAQSDTDGRPSANALWTHYDLSEQTRTSPSRQLGLRRILPRARTGRYSLSAAQVDVTISSPDDSEPSPFKRSVSLPTKKRPQTLTTERHQEAGSMYRYVQPNSDEAGHFTAGMNESKTSLTRSSSFRSSLRKKIGSAFKAGKNSSDQSSSGFSKSLRESFRRKRGARSSKTTDGHSKPSTVSIPVRLVPHRDVEITIEGDRPVFTPIPQPAVSPPKSTSF